MPVRYLDSLACLLGVIQKLTGDEATRQLRKKNIPTPVIALTGRVSCQLASNSLYILISERIAQRDGKVHGSWVSPVVLFSQLCLVIDRQNERVSAEASEEEGRAGCSGTVPSKATVKRGLIGYGPGR